MSNASSRAFYIREFLANEGVDNLAAVLAEIKDGDQEEEYLDFGATLQITDGASRTALDFGVYGPASTEKERAGLRRSVENSRAQIRRLKGAVYLFADMLERSLDSVEKDLDQRDEESRMLAGILSDTNVEA